MRNIDEIGFEAKGHVKNMLKTSGEEYQVHREKLRACALEFCEVLGVEDVAGQDTVRKVWQTYIDDAFEGGEDR